MVNHFPKIDRVFPPLSPAFLPGIPEFSSLLPPLRQIRLPLYIVVLGAAFFFKGALFPKKLDFLGGIRIDTRKKLCYSKEVKGLDEDPTLCKKLREEPAW